MAQVYVWGKYNLNVKYEEKLLTDSPKLEDYYNLLVGKSYSFSAVTGRYSLNDSLSVREDDSAAQYPYAIYGASSGDHLYYAKMRTELLHQHPGARSLMCCHIQYLGNHIIHPIMGSRSQKRRARILEM